MTSPIPVNVSMYCYMGAHLFCSMYVMTTEWVESLCKCHCHVRPDPMEYDEM